MNKKEKNKYIIVDEIVNMYLYKKTGEEYITLFDKKYLSKVMELNTCWHVSEIRNTGRYYCHSCEYLGIVNGKPKYKTRYLHVYLLDFPDGVIDHINGNQLDNRLENLRIVKRCDNLKNRNFKNLNNKSGYRNVCFLKGKWVVQLQVNGKNTRIGSFNTLEEANSVAIEMRKKYYGEYAGT